MKLVRYGAKGAEKPGLIDKSGQLRDLSGHVKDLDGEAYSPASLKKLAAIDPASLPPVLWQAVVLAVVTGLTKMLTGWWAARRAGVSTLGGLRAGGALVARGEFSVVIAGLGVDAGLEPQLDALGQQLASARNEAAANLAAKEKAEGQYNTEVQLHLSDNSKNKAGIADVQQKVNSDQVTIARLTADNTGLQTALNTANSNVQLSTATANKLQDVVTELRTANDGLAKSNEEFGRRNAELTSTLESLQARQEETQEQLAQTKENQQKLEAALKDRGYDPEAIISASTRFSGQPLASVSSRPRSIGNWSRSTPETTSRKNASSAGVYESPSISRPIQCASNSARMSLSPLPAISIW